MIKALRALVPPVALALLCAAAAPAIAQTPQPPGGPTGAPEKIDPKPIQPEPANPPAKSGDAGPSDSQANKDDPLGVPARVTAARVVAPWEADGVRGFSRVVGVIDGDRQRFYVQWLVQPEGHVLQTKELVDDEAAKLTFGDVRVEPESTGVEVFLDTVPDKDGLRDTWVLVIGPPGEVRFGPATN